MVFGHRETCQGNFPVVSGHFPLLGGQWEPRAQGNCDGNEGLLVALAIALAITLAVCATWDDVNEEKALNSGLLASATVYQFSHHKLEEVITGPGDQNRDITSTDEDGSQG
ncbi:hypothetical protein GRJ2_000904000 [Grus japonensis]|uniref:Uncharacterized protein n=1 Tax=Grus japonensis TaxID=30415 RepID=A0ABC9WJA2_GRUJA